MAKKRVETKKEEFVVANDEQRFWVADGSVLRDLFDLENALKDMSDETFSHHVNAEKNDFSNWAGYVLKEEKLANSFKKAKTKKAMLLKLNTRLKQLR